MIETVRAAQTSSPTNNQTPNPQPRPQPQRQPQPQPQPDFVGISGYAPLVRPLSFDALEISWETAAYEFGLFGISIKDLVKQGKKLIYRCGPGPVLGVLGLAAVGPSRFRVTWRRRRWCCRGQAEQTSQLESFCCFRINPTLKTTKPRPENQCNRSEHGLGGTSWNYSIAPTTQFVMEHPWLGLWPDGGYKAATDPWQVSEYR